MMKRLAVSLLVLAIAPACYSKYEGEMMRKDVDQLKSQVADMQKSNVDLKQMSEEARQQVLTALRITSHALEQMNQQLADRSRNAE